MLHGLHVQGTCTCSLRDGTAVQKAAAQMVQLGHVEALLVNCCAPGSVTAALPELRGAAGHRRLGAYANGFRNTTSSFLGQETSGGAALEQPPGDYDEAEGLILPGAYARHARRWVDLGATIVGGCCGVGPEHIRAVKAAL